jgi:ABC-type Mn2+/Zn2+ transport system permease subunit
VIVIGGFILGAVIGALTARKRGGKPADIAQYAVGFGIAFCLLGLFLTIFLERALLR